MSSYATKTTEELAEGDLVLNHGMRLRLTERKDHGQSFTDHPERGHLITFRGICENIDEIDDTFILHFLREDGFWSVQGNGWARWTVETIPDFPAGRVVCRNRIPGVSA